MSTATNGRAAAAALPYQLEHNAAFVDEDAAPIPVPFGVHDAKGSFHPSCPCPGTPHAEGDTIFLRPELDLKGGFTFTSAFSDNATDESGMPIEQALGMAYLVAGISGWTFTTRNAKGEDIPIPPSRANIMRLRWTPALAEVGEVAAGRYGVTALLPLLAGTNRSSRRSRTVRSTSARKPSSMRRQRRS